MSHEIPVSHPLDDLAPTARRIVEGARRLLVENGYTALSLESIAAECGLNKAAIRYYFGNKAGLMEVIVDWVAHDNVAAFIPVPESSESLQVDAFVERKAELSQNSELYLALLELLPRLLRDEKHTDRVRALYEWQIETYLALFSRDLQDCSEEDARSFCQLVVAIVDGLGIQYAIDKERFPVVNAYALLGRALKHWAGSINSDASGVAAKGVRG